MLMQPITLHKLHLPPPPPLSYLLISPSPFPTTLQKQTLTRRGGAGGLKSLKPMALQMPIRFPATKSMVVSSPSSPLNSVGNAALCQPSELKSSFFSPSLQLLVPRNQPSSIPCAAPKITMRAASKQAYICRDCGYIYNERTPFEKQPDKYFCPVCGAPKRRFRTYTPSVTKDANATDVRKARKAEIQRDEAIGKALPIAIVVGVAALAGLYFYLNSTF